MRTKTRFVLIYYLEERVSFTFSAFKGIIKELCPIGKLICHPNLTIY